LAITQYGQMAEEYMVITGGVALLKFNLRERGCCNLVVSAGSSAYFPVAQAPFTPIARERSILPP
jgi:hypothetical protein